MLEAPVPQALEYLKIIADSSATTEKAENLDQTYGISATQAYILDYKYRKHIFLWTLTALTLSLEDWGTLSVPAASWSEISFVAGMKIFAVGQATTVNIFVRCSDESFSNASSSSSVGANVNVAQIAGVVPGLDNTNELRVSNYGKNAAAGDTPILVDAAGRGQTQIIDSAGTNKLAIDASGRLTLIPNASTNVAQIAGVVPGLDNTNELRVSNYGKNAAAGDTPILVDAAGRIQDNITQWNGAAPGVTNPVITEDQIRAWIQNGQAFSVTTGKQTSGGSIQVGACIFNNNTAKNMLIYSIRVGIAASSVHQLNLVTADPAISGVTFAATNAKAGSGTASVATLEAQNTAVATTGNIFDMQYCVANNSAEFIANGASILLPASAVNGVLILINTASNVYFCGVKWIEY